jgi:valyl-tRNA synthetase
MDEKFTKPYDPNATENRIYEQWEQSGYFNPDNLPRTSTEPFTVVLPPPNVTGILHLGHAYESSIQDAAIRFNRMRGKKALWIPGTDSAAIATQARVEKNIQKEEGKSRHDIGREELVRRVTQFAKESEHTILGQLRKMGDSLDWSRYTYALDEKRTHAVFTAFKRMYDAGLIYRGHRIVNWDPKSQTTISDDEVVYIEEPSRFYYFQYGPFVIGTARPETKFGDKYVVVHPEDKRYAEYTHGQTIELEWINGPITATVIKDETADPEVGSGAMTITPWHSQLDFEIAERHKLEKEQVIDRYGKLLPITGEFAGMKIQDAREKIVEKLAAKGLVVKIDEKYIHNVATSERSGAMIEPQIMEQWFIGVDTPFTIPHSEIPGIPSGSTTTLKELMRVAVESGEVTMPQEGFKKTYLHWIENLHDWCISRQIWFGHRIPVWYKDTEVRVQVDSPGEGWEQEPDVLDTWFSSALWTFSTLGWPDETEDIKIFHPTSFMSPGYEILQLWVSRMILMGTFHLGQIPFRTVLIHGLVRDKDGRKFSKSLGNGIDPIDMIAKYGADALRMSLMVASPIGGDIRFDESKVKAYKNFANKLWNISRFIFSNTEGVAVDEALITAPADMQLIQEFKGILADITSDFEAYRFHLASEKLYHYIWHRLADEIIEESKTVLIEDEKQSRQQTLLYILKHSLIALHPFMPFITEEIWAHVPGTNTSLLMVEKWPKV